MLKVPPPTRVALGTLQVGAQKIELFLSPEWARYFESLNTQVLANGAAIEQSSALPALLADSMDAPDMFPSPPGPPGMPGAPGLALFMLQDDARDEPLFVPPSVDGVYVPLNSKDATGGVPGLTQFKLNLKNAAGTIVSWVTSAATAARTWTMPDKDGTVAVLSDFSAPPAIGGTTPAAGSFTTISTTGNVTVGAAVAGAALQPVSYCAGYSTTPQLRHIINHTGTGLLGWGSDAAGGMVMGRAGSTAGDIATTWATLNNAGVKFEAGFGCNGKAAQSAAASGGTLAGVIAALVANGILSS